MYKNTNTYTRPAAASPLPSTHRTRAFQALIIQEKKNDESAWARRTSRGQMQVGLAGAHLPMSFVSELLRSVPATRKSKGLCLLSPRRWLMTSDSPCRERRAGTTIGALDTLSSSPRLVVKLICDGGGGFQASGFFARPGSPIASADKSSDQYNSTRHSFAAPLQDTASPAPGAHPRRLRCPSLQLPLAVRALEVGD